ncbi:hypothetical protein H4R19_003169 [Coemansia spiralis]|nr:hypothetical protein H4R19_003169 [Coemansia spiralis]
MQRHRSPAGSRQQQQQQRRATPEEFPPLADDAQPPPYAALGPGADSGEGEYYYYQPASFPGYAAVQAVQAAQGAGEGQALLVRRQRVRRVRRRRRGGWVCGSVCFLVGVLLIVAFGSSVLYVARHMVPPSWDWQCAGLVPAVDRAFAFDVSAAGGTLGVESSDGVAVTHVYLMRAANRSATAVEVRAVVEARPGAAWADRIVVASEMRGTVPWVAVRVLRPQWEWPRDCVRAVLHISVPAAAEDEWPPAGQGTHLHVVTGPGALWALDAGQLALGALTVDMRSGQVQVNDLTLDGPITVATTSGRINATRVSAHSLDVATANAAVSLSQVAVRGNLSATTTNASIRVANATADRLLLRTANGSLLMRAVTARDISAESSNGAVQGSVVVGNAATVRTSNGPVALQAAPADPARPIAVALVSSNGQVDLGLDRVFGRFEVATSHARAQVRAPAAPHLIHFSHDSDARKTGVYGNATAHSRISLATSNAPAVLTFV